MGRAIFAVALLGVAVSAPVLWTAPEMPAGFSARALPALPALPVRATAAEGPVRVNVQGVVSSPDEALHLVVLAPSDGETVLPLVVDREEAAGINRRLQGGTGDGKPRPDGDGPALGSADLIGDTIASLGARLDRVVLEGVDPAAPRTRLFLSQSGKSLDVAGPAAESIAVALEAGAPIFVSRDVLAREGLTRESLDALGLGLGGAGPAAPGGAPEGGEVGPAPGPGEEFEVTPGPPPAIPEDPHDPGEEPPERYSL